MRQKGFGLIVIIVLLAVLGAGTLYYLGRQKVTTRAEPTSLPELKNETPTFEVSTLPEGWVKEINRIKTREDCYIISVKNLGPVAKSSKEHAQKAYPRENIDKIVENSPKYFEDFDSLTMPSMGIGEINTIFVMPGGSDIYEIFIQWTGSDIATSLTNQELSVCDIRKIQIPEVLNSIQFKR